jgi:hypothetical protein
MIMDELWLIDAGRLKRVLQRFESHLIELGLHKRAEVVKTIIKGLKLQPKIDAVPVVRCKNCKNRKTEKCPMWSEEFMEVYDGDGCYDRELVTHDRTTNEGFCDRGE